VLGLYVVFFALFFWRIHGGLGQYWDWTFPYYSDQASGIFTNKDAAWTAVSGGSPLGYASDYFFRFFMGLFIFMPPETLRYLLLVAMFAAGAYGMYQLARPHTKRGLAFVLGLAAFVNPAIFYKYTAGHFNYFLSFALFIWLVHFLVHRFGPRLRDAVVVGLLMSFIGVQIQFFVIAGIFLVLFAFCDRDKFRLKYVAMILGLMLAVNLVWLMNFLDGAASTAQTGANAAKVSFKASSASDFLSIFTFSFSKATLLTRFYAFYELLWNAGLFVFLLWLLTRDKIKERFDIALLLFLAVMIFLATGMYQAINLGPLTAFYPMFREVGHFAAVIVLAALVLALRLAREAKWRWIFMGLLAGSLFIVGVKFQYFSQGYSFATARADFVPFKRVLDTHPGTYRVLSYPFFDQYVFSGAPSDPPGQPPLKNSGHDSFATYSRKPFINNAVPPYQFQTSPQYRLLQTYNVDILRPYNVRYIFDFTQLYHSNYNLYVPPATYNNDLSLIKNDPHFLDKLLAANPGRLRRISQHVLEVTDPMPRVAAPANVFAMPADAQTDAASLFTRQQLHESFDFVDSADTRLALYTTQLTQLFATAGAPGKGAGFSQTVSVPSGRSTTVYASRAYSNLSYQASRNQLTLYTQAAPPLLVDGQPAGDMASDAPRQQVAQVTLAPGSTYYLSFGGALIRLAPGQSGDLGEARAGAKLQVLRASGNNLVANGSFEHDLWERKVGDCNNYDGNGSVDMRQATNTASDGHASLELSATHHDACTSTVVHMVPNTPYLLSFDYQSPNAGTANFFLGNTAQAAPLARGARAVAGSGWQSYATVVHAGPVAGPERLFLYALEGDGHTAAINRYDNVSIAPLAEEAAITLPAASDVYAKQDVPAGNHNFTFQDANYQATNLIANPSFEQGSWQAKVGDCNGYDASPNIGMQLVTADKTSGKQSLELSATRHDACIHASANVVGSTNYALSFDYRTIGTRSYGYTTSFDDPSATLNRNQLESNGSGWHTAHITVHVPKDATTLTLYLYAFEGNGRATSTVRYDNVSLVRLPDFTNRFFVVQQPAKPVSAPHITFGVPSQTSRTIHVRAATTPFFVSLSETYHPAWHLELAGQGTGGLSRWLPNAVPSSAGQHVLFDGTIHGWLVNPAALCAGTPTGCTHRADGSYDINLVAEFTPERWFAVAAFISWASVTAATVYLLVVRPKDEPTYTARTARGRQ
jgi:hypothetical protein